MFYFNFWFWWQRFVKSVINLFLYVFIIRLLFIIIISIFFNIFCHYYFFDIIDSVVILEFIQ